VSPTVRITGWRKGLNKVSMTKAIQRSSALDLAGSKSCTDRVLEGKTVDVRVGDALVARELAQELQALGAVADVVDVETTVEEAISSAEAILPGHAAPDGEVDDRWQAIIAVAEFIETEPEAVWSFAKKWGGHPDDDLRMAISTCVLEHLLEQHFDAIFARVEEAAHTDQLFAKTVANCSTALRVLREHGSEWQARADRFDRLVSSIRTQRQAEN
jgi:hypothetical protein